ncbi:uncharacterized protein LOC144648490 [Oculina patagonica]
MAASCTCAAGEVGYCNHTLALLLKICKYSLFESKTTEDLNDELDENPALACTSKLQSWHKRGRGDSIHPQPVMDLVVTKIKPDDEKSDKPVLCQLYEARKITKPDVSEEERFKKAIAAINPKMGIATLSPNASSEMVQTKYGSSPVGSTNSYQLSYTEANFPVYANISTVPRSPDINTGINNYPRFPLKDTQPRVYPDTLTSEQRTFLSSLEVDEDELNKIEMETREQVGSERWREERRFRFTASRFHLISRRKKNHDTFAKQLINPEEFSSRHTVISGRLPAVKLMKVMAEESVFNCPIGGQEAKTYIFFHMDLSRKGLEITSNYYAQVQGQLAITGASWCDFVVYTFKGMSIQRITFDQQFWDNISQSLSGYYFRHFITFALAEFKQQDNDSRPTRA